MRTCSAELFNANPTTLAGCPSTHQAHRYLSNHVTCDDVSRTATTAGLPGSSTSNKYSTYRAVAVDYVDHCTVIKQVDTCVNPELLKLFTRLFLTGFD